MSDQPTGDVSAFSDDEFEVEEIGSPKTGPAAAIEKAASFLIGEGPERRKHGDTGPDPVLLERRVLLKGTPKAKLFTMSDAALAQEYAELEHRSKTTGEVNITKIKELMSGTNYALFITWIEYPKPEEVIRERVEGTMREKRAKFLRSVNEQRQRDLGTGPKADDDDGVSCTAKTARKKPCRAKRKKGTLFCGRHAPPKVVEPEPVPMDSPPPTHVPLGSSS